MLYSDIDDAYKKINMDDFDKDNFTSTYGSEGANLDYLYWDNSKLASTPTEKQRKVLTHRDCLNCYFNPTDPNFNFASKHINSCETCKKELASMGNLGNLGQYSTVQTVTAQNNKPTNEIIADYLEADKREKQKMNDKMDNIIQYLLNMSQSSKTFPTSNNNQIENYGVLNGKYTIECNFTNVVLLFLVILLLIDIILRFK